ncbi:PREDICTED: mucin-5AC-like, partial [Amphimedon queenslandica]|uniref:Uncharacterized protein n=1 Tax=Amphimedon queenslandica TaxID=400682 RepID=A0AAN0J2H0_AMPQE
MCIPGVPTGHSGNDHSASIDLTQASTSVSIIVPTQSVSSSFSSEVLTASTPSTSVISTVTTKVDTTIVSTITDSITITSDNSVIKSPSATGTIIVQTPSVTSSSDRFASSGLTASTSVIPTVTTSTIVSSITDSVTITSDTFGTAVSSTIIVPTQTVSSDFITASTTVSVTSTVTSSTASATTGVISVSSSISDGGSSIVPSLPQASSTSVIVVCEPSSIVSQTITPTPIPELSECCQIGNNTAYTRENIASLDCFIEQHHQDNECNSEALTCCECCYIGRIQSEDNKECIFPNSVGLCRSITEHCCSRNRMEQSSSRGLLGSTQCITRTVTVEPTGTSSASIDLTQANTPISIIAPTQSVSSGIVTGSTPSASVISTGTTEIDSSTIVSTITDSVTVTSDIPVTSTQSLSGTIIVHTPSVSSSSYSFASGGLTASTSIVSATTGVISVSSSVSDVGSSIVSSLLQASSTSIIVVCEPSSIVSQTITPKPIPELSECCQIGNNTAYTRENIASLDCFIEQHHQDT